MNSNSEFEFLRKSFGVLQRIASIEFDQAKSKWSTLQYAERAFESVHIGRSRTNENKRRKRSKSEHGRSKYRRKNLSTSDLLVYSVSSGGEVVEAIKCAVAEAQCSLTQIREGKHPNFRDCYGFYRIDDDIDFTFEDIPDSLRKTIKNCEKEKQRFIDKKLHKANEFEKDWEFFMESWNNNLMEDRDLKKQVRKGITPIYRQKIWTYCINKRVGLKRNKNKDYYRNLLKRNEGRSNPNIKQIELDLLRSLPNNSKFQTFMSDSVIKLRNVLVAFSWHCEQIGYCQGLNRIAAIALLVLPEEDAFWCLVAIVEHILPKDYYTNVLLGAQTDQKVLRDFIMKLVPKVYNKLEEKRVDLSLFTLSWFLAVFVENLPVETYFRIWDSFLLEGDKILFRFAIAIFKKIEEDICKLNENPEIHAFMRIIQRSLYDHHTLADIAFKLGPFSKKSLANKRELYLEETKKELEEWKKRESRNKTIE
ncbi:DgyrCDS988 [Dimorphilus gyrociliatus]|uniref:DgyrCDS988 n=1 Tax=Dimorphilus gyrociliatus TaxID=2664684 RepID=A0A7I8V7Q5_9ANNE|nr:DgyrCDS988 [Dimorphilus gyrociliatus]